MLSLFVLNLATAYDDARLKNSFREDRNGWVYVHLEGKPGTIGFQHGYLLAPEIDDALKMMAHFLKGGTQKEWSFYRDAAKNIFWPNIEKEYQEELQGIADGLKARGYAYDAIDVTALNGWMELAWYYLPSLANKVKADSMNNKAPGNCSAFIATGSYTEDGKIVMAHNSWVDYIVGERWNIVADIVPERGHRIFMDSYPGFIHSGDDFLMNSAGLLYTETTIAQFKGFKEDAIPEFVRARKAGQYASSIDQFVEIMKEGNNGAYANTWLIGDTKTNEIGKLDLGLKNTKLWRTKDGVYVGSNFGSDEKLIAEETTFDPKNTSTTMTSRKIRWEQLVNEKKGQINAAVAKIFEGDHINANIGAKSADRCVICGHIDEDPIGADEVGWGKFYPAGAVQGKVTTTDMAKEMRFWARKGHPCGEDFLVGPFVEKHPEYKWMQPYLVDMKSHPWTMFEAKR
jgi:hypothetical protein